MLRQTGSGRFVSRQRESKSCYLFLVWLYVIFAHGFSFRGGQDSGMVRASGGQAQLDLEIGGKKTPADGPDRVGVCKPSERMGWGEAVVPRQDSLRA